MISIRMWFGEQMICWPDRLMRPANRQICLGHVEDTTRTAMPLISSFIGPNLPWMKTWQSGERGYVAIVVLSLMMATAPARSFFKMKKKNKEDATRTTISRQSKKVRDRTVR
jgi:hypothetical protein